MNIPLTTPSEFMESIRGHAIDGGDFTQDGMHLFLDDGRVIVLTGTFVAFVGSFQKQTLQ